MIIEQAIYTALCAHAGVKALVVKRVYQVELPESVTLPAVVVRKISGPESQTFEGPAMAWDRFQVTSWADDYAGAKALAAQVKLCLGDHAGLLGVGGVNCFVTFMTDHDLVDPAGVKYIPADYEVVYNV